MRLRKRGIVLISILVLTLVATFFIGALLQMSPTRLRRTVLDERQDNAGAAARAGVEYALSRLADNPKWRGGTTSVTTVQTSHMVVREDRGNVFGWIRSDGGEWAGFRLRFNYQDGDGGADELDEPARAIPTEAISYNNLQGSSPVKIPLGTGPNNAFSGDVGFAVPENSVALLVEGLVGPDQSPDASPVSSAGKEGQTVVRSVEGLYQVTGFSQGAPDGAVLQAGGNSRFVLGSAPTDGGTIAKDDFRGFLRLMASDQEAVMRTKGSSKVRFGAGKSGPYNFYPDMNSEVRVGDNDFQPITKAGQEFTTVAEPVNDTLLDIEWNKIATSDQANRLRLPAGVYTVEGGASDASRVKYYPMTFAEYRQALVHGETPVSADVPEEFASRVALNGKTVTAADGGKETRSVITFEKDVEVIGVGTNSDLAIVPARGAKQKAVSDSNAAIPPSQFVSLHQGVKEQTGTAIMQYLSESTGQSTVTVMVNGSEVTYSNGGVTDGDPIAVANAVIAGQSLTTSSLGSQSSGLPGTQLASGLGSSGGSTSPATLPPSTIGSGGGGTGPDYTAPAVGPTKSLASTGGVTGSFASSGGTGPPAPAVLPSANVSGGGGGAVELSISDPSKFLAAVHSTTGQVPGAVLETNVDPLEVPAAAVDDSTEPHDLEIAFAPTEGESAAIRGQGNVLLGTHVSGEGGAVVAAGRIDLVGLGVDMSAGQGERDGVSLYSKKDITISTYDKKRNKYWDASIKGVVFAKGDLTVRLGETRSGSAPEPEWGKFDFLGSMIVLGSAPSHTGVLNNVPSTPEGTKDYQTQSGVNGVTASDGTEDAETEESGNASFVASGIRLFYEPKFLAPYLDGAARVPIFGAVSVVEK